MYIKHIDRIDRKAISGEGIKNVLKQIPIGEKEGWADHTLRVFTIARDGHTPKHKHDWEHINYVISGTGTLEVGGQKHELKTGTFAVVPPNVEHQYSNRGDKDFVMICIVPARGDY